MRIVAAAVSTVVLLVLDFAWLLLIMRGRAKRMIETIQQSELKLRLVPALLAYGFMVLGLLVWVLPRVEKNSVFLGTTFGLILYGVYDTTNLATIDKWDPVHAFIDVLWGGFLYTVASLVYVYME
jgi:uncharacterized membrane protein